MFAARRITVGITGGIAAYKAAELVSWLTKNNADVHVIMTPSACEFITPLTLRTLSTHAVATEMFTSSDLHVPHINLSTCDLFVVVPATANVIAKYAHGIADDLISSSLLATTAPVLIAPAMNVHMYQNVATQQNIEVLQQRGVHFVEPGVGRLACGTEGIGRLADLDIIEKAICDLLLPQQDFKGLHVLVTAGPTREPIDPVRYLGNRSSGKMGYAIAEAAQKRGAKVTLVSGPVNLPAPSGVELVSVESAHQMYDAVWQRYPQTDIVIKAAAVADFKVKQIAPVKIKKSKDLVLELVANEDILTSLGQKKEKQILVGFAAETNDLVANATKKLKEKNLDLIVANDVSEAGAGFEIDTNIITTIAADAAAYKQKQWPKMTKREAAEVILDTICQLPAFSRLATNQRRNSE